MSDRSGTFVRSFSATIDPVLRNRIHRAAEVAKMYAISRSVDGPIPRFGEDRQMEQDTYFPTDAVGSMEMWLADPDRTRRGGQR